MEWTKENVTKMIATQSSFTGSENYYIKFLIFKDLKPQPFKRLDFYSWDEFLNYYKIARLELEKRCNTTKCIIL